MRVKSLNELNPNGRIPTQILSGHEGPLGEEEWKKRVSSDSPHDRTGKHEDTFAN